MPCARLQLTDNHTCQVSSGSIRPPIFIFALLSPTIPRFHLEKTVKRESVTSSPVISVGPAGNIAPVRSFPAFSTNKSIVPTSADDKPFIVKFTFKYSPELHKFYADQKCTPVLCGFAKLPRNIFGVAMVFVEYATHLRPSSTDEQEKLEKQLADLVKELHAASFVHGDLQLPNIVCEANKDIVLLDCDWGGEAVFPFEPLNPELSRWHDLINLKITQEW